MLLYSSIGNALSDLNRSIQAMLYTNKRRANTASTGRGLRPAGTVRDLHNFMQ
jgi:hypothetical protein